MITVKVEQGTDAWFALRAGIPTASKFSDIITTKGELSKSSKKLSYQLAGERITGVKEDSYQNAIMLRGIEMEDEARRLYSFVTGQTVDEVGVVYQNKDKRFSCSPDGLVGDDGGLEIKCPTLSVHVEYLLGDKLPTTYFQQLHGSMFVTGRRWWDFMSYYPGMPPFIKRVKWDAEYMKKMTEVINDFCNSVDIVETQIREKM